MILRGVGDQAQRGTITPAGKGDFLGDFRPGIDRVAGKAGIEMPAAIDGGDAKNIAQSVEASLDKEALRVVKKMPHWTPSIWGGKYAKSYMKQPITFRFE